MGYSQAVAKSQTEELDNNKIMPKLSCKDSVRST